MRKVLEYMLELELQFLFKLCNLFADSNAALLEVIKILMVSCGWIGGLILFIKRREKLQFARN